jgi:hypothetical protein
MWETIKNWFFKKPNIIEYADTTPIITLNKSNYFTYGWYIAKSGGYTEFSHDHSKVIERNVYYHYMRWDGFWFSRLKNQEKKYEEVGTYFAAKEEAEFWLQKALTKKENEVATILDYENFCNGSNL